MAVRKISPSVFEFGDIVAIDRSGDPVLLVDVRDHAGEGPGGAWDSPDARHLYYNAVLEGIRYVMRVNRESISVLDVGETRHAGPGPDGDNPGMFPMSDPVVSFRTADILSRYEPNFAAKRIYRTYMQVLVELWLGDLAYLGRSPEPPGSAELAAIGLRQRLEGGTVEVAES